jgi:hypothetical protein
MEASSSAVIAEVSSSELCDVVVADVGDGTGDAGSAWLSGDESLRSMRLDGFLIL